MTQAAISEWQHFTGQQLKRNSGTISGLPSPAATGAGKHSGDLQAGQTPSLSDDPETFMPSTEQPCLSSLSHSTPHSQSAVRSYTGDVDTGFLQVYDQESRVCAEQLEFRADQIAGSNSSDPRQQELQQCFTETYFEYCYTWCPVLEIQTLEAELARSPMLSNALSLAASHVQPPLIKHEGPEAYYEKARMMFYTDAEPDVLVALKSVALFYWWASQPPLTAHRHSSWWWTSVIIRHLQQINTHREPVGLLTEADAKIFSVRRRLWWTVFARERLTSLCQSKPCIVCPEDMTIQMPQPSDFPSDPASQKRGRIFIEWVRLCAIIGKISTALARRSTPASQPFSTALRQELVEWVQGLPPDLQLSVQSKRTELFDRDVHQLHLPYLTTVIILHLQQSTPDLPQALPPAIVAAHYTARILRDILSRGNARFLMPITCWYTGTAFIALLQASRISQISTEAEESLDILELAISHLQKMWASADVIQQGFERLRKIPRSMVNFAQTGSGRFADESILSDEFDWTRFFPFVSRSTSKIADFLLAGKEANSVTPRLSTLENTDIHGELFHHYQDLLEPLLDMNFDVSNLNSEAMS
ncbi:Cutinase transcription factor 1 beta [Paramyrothecium foliicola]|nr:Cutinase transcription factor 1 beta [Paramyrothecium foliicola]